MEMTITRGLSELKLLNDRIARKINDSTYIAANKKSAKKVNNLIGKEEFMEKSKSDYQSILDLIERRKKIKSAIVDSNAKTFVTIADKQMTVAEAIERKESIGYEKILLSSMENQYRSAVAKMNVENERVQQKIDELLLVTFGKESKSKVAENEIEAISNPYSEQNSFELIDALKLADKIETLRKEIEDFESNVDFGLSESNCLNKIMIED